MWCRPKPTTIRFGVVAVDTTRGMCGMTATGQRRKRQKGGVKRSQTVAGARDRAAVDDGWDLDKRGRPALTRIEQRKPFVRTEP